MTVEGHSYPLERPFSVIATQNPAGASGTQLLPDSQTDRFMVRISMGYPDNDSECKMLLNRSHSNPLDDVNCVVTKEQLSEMQNSVKEVFVKREIAEYIVSLVSATRNSNLILRGASPRATLSLTDMAKAAAYAAGKDYVTPQDIQNVFLPTIGHRIILSSESVSRHLSSEQVLKHILSKVRVPRI